jgi:hypothetical protein
VRSDWLRVCRLARTEGWGKEDEVIPQNKEQAGGEQGRLKQGNKRSDYGSLQRFGRWMVVLVSFL